MTETADADSSMSVTDVMFHTKQGKHFLLMGGLYTFVVSICFSVLFFTAGVGVTGAAITGYVGLTAIMVYLRAPSPELIFPGFLLFAVIPVLVAVVICLGLFFGMQ